MFCNLPKTKERIFNMDVGPHRIELIIASQKKWINGTNLKFYFYDQPNTDGEFVSYRDGSKEWITWLGSESEKEIVRQAFDTWKSLGIGLDFTEVYNRYDAEIRIGFMRGNGSWSYLGRDILEIPLNKRTMNFGWNIGDDLDTALHEIGHTIGFPHEHQNPNAGILWDEEAVYADLAGAPNYWDRDKTYRNIIRKIDPDSVQGGIWDPNSIMHYPFKAGLIIKPDEFRESGLTPQPGLSEGDIHWVKSLYPNLSDQDFVHLEIGESQPLAVIDGQQKNFIFKPEASGKYHIKTTGQLDGVMVLFKRGKDGDLIYLSGEDDSGENHNAEIAYRLLKDEEYVIGHRKFYGGSQSNSIIIN